MESALLVNVVQLDAKVDARDSANTHQLDVWCFYEVSRTFNPAVGLGTSISDVQLPPPELRKVAHIPPTETSRRRYVQIPGNSTLWGRL